MGYYFQYLTDIELTDKMMWRWDSIDLPYIYNKLFKVSVVSGHHDNILTTLICHPVLRGWFEIFVLHIQIFPTQG